MSPQGQALATACGDRGLNPLRMKLRTWGMWGTPGPAEWLTAAVTAGKQGNRPEGTRQRAPDWWPLWAAVGIGRGQRHPTLL